jgi:hypothetical protein
VPKGHRKIKGNSETGKMADMQDLVEAIDSKEKKDQKEQHSSRLKTGLLVIGSALLGGIAVAFWNRRTLTDIRNQPSEKDSEPNSGSEDAIY